MKNSGYTLAGFNRFESEILAEIERVNITILKIWFIEWNKPMMRL